VVILLSLLLAVVVAEATGLVALAALAAEPELLTIVVAQAHQGKVILVATQQLLTTEAWQVAVARAHLVALRHKLLADQGVLVL
jgi:hypothetical protein